MMAHRPVLSYLAPGAATPTPAWDRRGTVVLTCAALCFVIVLAYAGIAWPMAVYRLLTDGSVAVLWIVSAYGIGSLVPLPDQSSETGAFRAVTRIAIGLGVMSLLTLGLGLAGAMSRPAALALLGAGLAIALCRLLRVRATLTRNVRAWRDAPAGWAWLWALAMPFLAMSLIAALVPPGVLWGDEPNGYDVVEYHLQVPREWYEAGRITGLHHNAFSYFPFNVEMQFLLAMHARGGPWAGMYLAQFMHVGYVALSVAAVYAAARSLGGGGKGAATLAGVAAAATPWLTLLAPVAYNEGGLLLYGTLAVGWTLHALRIPAHRVASMVVAGAMAGFACGVKLTAVPMLLLSLPVTLFAIAAARRESLPRAFLAAVMFVAVGVAVFSPWLVRNVIWTGNPVFPEAQAVFGRGHFTDAQAQRWKAAHSPRPDQQGFAPRFKAVWEQIAADVRYGYVLIPLALALAAMSYRKRETWLLLGMLAILAIVWLGFTHLQSRFFVLGIPIAALLIAQAAGRAAVPARAAAVVLVLIGLVTMHLRLSTWLHEKQLTAVLGVERLNELTPQVAQDVPDDVTLALAGDARAFFYQRPMSKLRYRTVFDVADVDDWLVGWVGGSVNDAKTVIVVDPSELARFGRTYRGLPPVPEEILRRGEPFVFDPAK